MSVNRVTLLGRLGQNPEVRFTPSGAAVATLNLATNEYWTDKTGQKQEKTEWHRVVVWGKQAERCQQYLSKGKQVFVEGRLQTRQWQDQAGVTKYSTEVVAQNVQFVGASPGAGANQQDETSAGYSVGSDNGASQSATSYQRPASEPSFTEDDIPFWKEWRTKNSYCRSYL